MEIRGKLPSHRRLVGDGPIIPARDYSTSLVENVSGAKTRVGKYIFEVGAILSVEKRDVDYLLSLRSGGGCVGCGGSGPAPLFKLVEG